jgi:1A family penicillin-binding protein
VTRRRAAGVAIAAQLLVAGCSLAPVDLESARPLPLRSTIRAADGSLLARLYKQNRAYVPLDGVPTALVNAVIAAEDARFFRHPGVDFRAIARAALTNIDEGEVVQGGSTITQQYVKNTFFRDPGRTLERKARELRLALEIERVYSKREILERYLNTVYFGEGAYGVKAATETYFRGGLGSLTNARAALLASLIKAPSYYDPRAHPRRAVLRRNYVLERMAELGHLDASALQRAAREPLGVTNAAPRVRTKQPYFVEAVRQEILKDPRLGATPDERDQRLREAGLRIDTTLVPRLQAAAERAVKSTLDRPDDPEAALVALRPQNGRIVAMVGGRDWQTSQVNLALGVSGGGSGRQPGSAFKPIALAAALEQGVSLDDRYESSPITFTFDNGETWRVSNAEGSGYGLMPLDEALVHSVNAVYARLAVQMGAGTITSQAELMGVRTELAPVPSVALGADEVSVLDMAAAYATIANGGTSITPTTITEIRVPGRPSLGPRQEEVDNALDPGNAYLLTRVMEQVIQRGTGRAANIGRPAAGKTGTTNDYADAWFVGFTPQLVTAVWVGHPEGRVPMTSVHGIPVSGGSFPALIWKSFMLEAMDGVPAEDFAAPEGAYVRVMIDPVSGLLAAPWCPGEPRVVLRVEAPRGICPPPEPEPTPSPAPSETPTPTPTPTPSGDKQPDPDEPGKGDPGRDEPGKGQPGREPSPEPQPTASPR